MAETAPPAELLAILRRHGLVGSDETPEAERLTGGVSSEIWKIAARSRVFCVKRAMERLAVADDWCVPVERNRYERLWYQTVGARVPDAAPAVLMYDDGAMLFAMDYLEPGTHPLWKAELMAGRVDVEFARVVGERLAQIHAATASDAALAATFDTGALFDAIRLDPYLRATAARHPDLAEPLLALVERTAGTRLALVHGDVSPKNILAGPAGPVFLDAECAWYGDPAFDLAFCLNHLLLKCLAAPRAGRALLAAFEALSRAHLAGVAWEPAGTLEARVASLLPGLLLARIDGKSPVEYITREDDRARVRAVARAGLLAPPERLEDVAAAWGAEFVR